MGGVAFADCAGRLCHGKHSIKRIRVRRRRFSLTPCLGKAFVEAQGLRASLKNGLLVAQATRLCRPATRRTEPERQFKSRGTAFSQRSSRQFRSAGRRPERAGRPRHPFLKQALSCSERFPRGRTDRRDCSRRRTRRFARLRSNAQGTVRRRVECFMAFSFTTDCFALSAAFCQTRKRTMAEPCRN